MLLHNDQIQRRMTPTIKFRHRPLKKDKHGNKPLDDDHPRTLYIRLIINKVRHPDYASGVKVRPSEWDQKSQTVLGRSQRAKSLNERLMAIQTEHLTIMNQLLTLRRPVNARILAQEWTKGAQPVPTVCQAWDLLLVYLRSLKGTDQELSKATLLKWDNGVKYLRMYIQQTTRQQDIDVMTINVAWAKKWHQWLMTYVDQTGETKKGKQASNTAAKYVSYLDRVMDTYVESQHLAGNPLAPLTITRTKAKEITYLEPEHIARLAGMKLIGKEKEYRDLALLGIYTGLDYPDLLKVLHNLAQYRRDNMLVIPRGKQNVNKTEQIARIPILPEAEPLLAVYAGRRIYYADGTINRVLKVFASVIGFPDTLSWKILRKTTGTTFLNEGYDLDVVGMILGHADSRTTKRHYAKFLDRRLQKAVEQVGVNIMPKPIPVTFSLPPATTEQ